MKKLSVICLLVVGIILISGCIDGEKTKSKTSNSSQSSMNETSNETSASPSISIPSPLDNYSSASVPEISRPELIPGEFDINITSYYFVYLRDCCDIYQNLTTKLTFDPVETNYVIYHLSMKNNDTNTLNFSINKLQLHTGNQVFTPAEPGTILKYFKGWVFLEIENEKRLNDTLLLPHQTLEGIVIFQVDNYTTLFDISFSLRYNTAPIPSTSYEKSLEALTVAEQFNYSIAFGMPPYDSDMWGGYTYYPPEPGNYGVWANWVNRTVFESYKKHDEMSLPKEKPGRANIAYAVKIIPKQDLTVFHTNHSGYEESSSRSYEIKSAGKYKETQLYVVDDSGEELFNKSIDSRDDDTGLAILDNQTYRPFSENMPQMFIPQATIVHFSFYSIYGWSMAMRFTINDQDIILDEQYNIILARYDNTKMVS
jgi:hypothetical protein